MPRQTLSINDAEAVALMTALADQKQKYLQFAEDFDCEGEHPQDGEFWRQQAALAERLHARIMKRPELAKR